MIESIIESVKRNSLVASGGTLTTAIGSQVATGVVGGVSGDILYWQDDAGAIKSNQLSGANTFAVPCDSVSTAVTALKVSRTDRHFMYFYTNNAYVKTAIASPGAFLSTQAGTFYGGTDLNPLSKFSINEGVLIKSIFIRMPYQYTLADGQVNLKLLTHIAEASTVFLSSIGEGGVLCMAMENVEIPINAYVPPPVGANAPWSLGYLLDNELSTIVGDGGISPGVTWPYKPAVSMVSAPNNMNGQVLPIIAGLRIVHTSPMTA